MQRDKLTSLAVALVSLLVFLFLGAVTLESATSLSTINQQGILRSLVSVIDPGSGSLEELQERTTRSGLDKSEDLFAFILQDEGQAVFLGSAPVGAGRQALLTHIQQNKDLEPHRMLLDVPGAEYVWVSARWSAGDGKVYLVHERHDDGLLTRFKLYFVPSVIALLVCAWVSVWSGLIVRRSIVAAKKQKELELEVVRQEEASRIKSAFLANMNHELRTPLNAIIGFSQMMHLQLLGPLGHNKYAGYVESIMSAGTHLQKLIGNILDISKIESGEETLEEERVCFVDVLSECLSMTAKDFEEKGQTVDLAQDHAKCCIIGDRLKLRQILLNLLTNANKFTPEGGRIIVTMMPGAEGGIALSVTDTGKGIAKAELETVLQPFKRSQDGADTAKDGFGLGLPLSKALAGLHGATFEMESEPGIGTTVRIVFPEERVMLGHGAEQERAIA